MTCVEKKTIELDAIGTGLRIKQLMKERNVEVKEISKILNISIQAVYRWQKGEVLPTLNNLYLLAQILDTDVDDILVAKQFPK